MIAGKKEIGVAAGVLVTVASLAGLAYLKNRQSEPPKDESPVRRIVMVQQGAGPLPTEGAPRANADSGPPRSAPTWVEFMAVPTAGKPIPLTGYQADFVAGDLKIRMASFDDQDRKIFVLANGIGQVPGPYKVILRSPTGRIAFEAPINRVEFSPRLLPQSALKSVSFAGQTFEAIRTYDVNRQITQIRLAASGLGTRDHYVQSFLLGTTFERESPETSIGIQIPGAGFPPPAVYCAYPELTTDVRVRLQELVPTQIRRRVTFENVVLRYRYGQPYLELTGENRVEVAKDVWMGLAPAEGPPRRAGILRPAVSAVLWLRGLVVRGKATVVNPQKAWGLGLQIQVQANTFARDFQVVDIPAPEGIPATLTPGPIKIVLDVDLEVVQQAASKTVTLSVVNR